MPTAEEEPPYAGGIRTCTGKYNKTLLMCLGLSAALFQCTFSKEVSGEEKPKQSKQHFYD